MSTLFSSNGLYEAAEKARKPIYQLGTLINEKQVLAMAHVRAAVDASMQGNNKDELKHIELALNNIAFNADISEIVNILTLSFAVSSYARQDRIELSNSYLKTLNSKINTIQNSAFLNTYYTLALAYNANANQKYKRAEQYVQSIYKQIHASHEASNLMQLEKLLANIHENLGNSKQSLIHYKSFVNIRDSVNKANSRKKFAYVQSLFESEKKDLEISKQQKNIKLLSTKNQLKNQWLIFGSLFLIALFIIVILWRSKKHANHKTELQKTFSKNLIHNLEKERKRISSELHDGIGQNLLLIKNQTLDASEDKKIELALIEDTINDVRQISQNLHPFRFEKLGLFASIKDTVETFQQSSKIFYSEDIEIPKDSITKDKEIFVYRMIQECLNNVEKHSQATACKISLEEQDNSLLFEIKDNGIGFNVTKNSNLLKSLGLKTLKERAQLIGAELSIHSVLENGTTIKIKVFK
ncbi:MAG: sensor histidine kinase [Oceanihabitans sp.]